MNEMSVTWIKTKLINTKKNIKNIDRDRDRDKEKLVYS